MTQSEQLDTQPSEELMLIQVDEDAAPCFGAETPSWFEVHPNLGLTPADRAGLHEATAPAIGRLNFVRQVSPAGGIKLKIVSVLHSLSQGRIIAQLSHEPRSPTE